MAWAAENGHENTFRMCKDFGATDFDRVMAWAAENGHENIVKFCKDYGANIDWVMRYAVENGYENTFRMCNELGTNVDLAMRYAAENGHENIVILCLDFRSTDINVAIAEADENGYKNVVRMCIDIKYFLDKIIQMHEILTAEEELEKLKEEREKKCSQYKVEAAFCFVFLACLIVKVWLKKFKMVTKKP